MADAPQTPSEPSKTTPSAETEGPSEPRSSDELSPARSRRLAFASLTTALGPLVPIPFLDLWLRDHLRHRMVAEIAAHWRVDLSSDDIGFLARGRRNLTVQGCLLGCAGSAAWRALRYVVATLLRTTVRKLLYVLAIKDSADTLSWSYHQGLLLEHAFEHGLVTPATVESVRAALVATCDEVDPRPIESLVRALLRRSRRLLRQAGRLMGRALLRRGKPIADRIPLEAEQELLTSVVDELDEGLRGEAGYWRSLVGRFERTYRAHGATSGPESEAS